MGFIVGIAVMSLYTACCIAVNPFKTPLLHFFIYMKMFGFLRFCTAVWHKIGTRLVQATIHLNISLLYHSLFLLYILQRYISLICHHYYIILKLKLQVIINFFIINSIKPFSCSLYLSPKPVK